MKLTFYKAKKRRKTAAERQEEEMPEFKWWLEVRKISFTLTS